MFQLRVLGHQKDVCFLLFFYTLFLIENVIVGCVF